jgi:hypothetical protein
MHLRCSEKADPNTINNYYVKGVRVCERWFSFESFRDDLGHPENSTDTLDRIDPNGNYEPSNCRWLPKKMQNSNTTRTKVVTVNGEQMVLAHAIKMLREQARLLHPKN